MSKSNSSGGQVVTASITNESVDELGLAKGKKAYAIIKSSDVMVAVALMISGARRGVQLFGGV